MGCTVHLISAPHQPGEMNVPLHSCNFMIPAPLFNICWKLLLLKSIKSTCFQQTFNNFVSIELLFTKLSGMLGDMFLWLVANLKQGVIYFIKQGGGNHKIAWVYLLKVRQSRNVSFKKRTNKFNFTTMKPQVDMFLFVFWKNRRLERNISTLSDL